MHKVFSSTFEHFPNGRGEHLVLLWPNSIGDTPSLSLISPVGMALATSLLLLLSSPQVQMECFDASRGASPIIFVEHPLGKFTSTTPLLVVQPCSGSDCWHRPRSHCHPHLTPGALVGASILMDVGYIVSTGMLGVPGSALVHPFRIIIEVV